MGLRVTAWLKWFCFNVSKKTKSERKHGPLSLQELTEVEVDCTKSGQTDLNSQENYKQLHNKFGVTEDTKGVIRCKGRLEYADLPAEAKEPIIVPKDHHQTFLEIQRCHKKVHHCGVKSTFVEHAHQILGPQGETSCEEDIVPVCDMGNWRVQHLPNQQLPVYQNLGSIRPHPSQGLV